MIYEFVKRDTKNEGHPIILSYFSSKYIKSILQNKYPYQFLKDEDNIYGIYIPNNHLNQDDLMKIYEYLRADYVIMSNDSFYSN